MKTGFEIRQLSTPANVTTVPALDQLNGLPRSGFHIIEIKREKSVVIKAVAGMAKIAAAAEEASLLVKTSSKKAMPTGQVHVQAQNKIDAPMESLESPWLRRTKKIAKNPLTLIQYTRIVLERIEKKAMKS